MNKSVEPVYSAAQPRWRLWISVAMIIAVAALAYLFVDCRRSPGRSGPTCPPTASPAPAPACAAPLQPAVTSLIDMPHNGLAPSALVGQGDLLGKLHGTILAPDMLRDASWRPLLARPGAGDLVQYVVSCALAPCATVAIPDAPALAGARAQFPAGWPGELGVCGAGEALAGACWQRVSACVAARVNAVDARVTISLRGEGQALRTRVPVETAFRENHGTPIQSFARCDQACLWGDPLRRNCDWQPRFVGQCVHGDDDSAPGRPVRLALAHGRGRIRVCEGLYGCDDVAPAPGAGASTSPVFAHGALVAFPTFYAGHLLGQALGTTVEIACPANGPRIPGTKTRTGYYSVMIGNGDPASGAIVTSDVVLASAPGEYDRYPASEAKVFTYREGGFYGDMLPPVTPNGEARQLYACASALWTDAAAVMEDRLCADPATACFASQAGQCDLLPSPPPVPAPPAGLCSPPAQPMDQIAYKACQATDDLAHTLAAPYTVYLSHPCDLFASDVQCEALLERTACDEVARRGGTGEDRKRCEGHASAGRGQGSPPNKP